MIMCFPCLAIINYSISLNTRRLVIHHLYTLIPPHPYAISTSSPLVVKVFKGKHRFISFNCLNEATRRLQFGCSSFLFTVIPPFKLI
jgi:hypothetical protein